MEIYTPEHLFGLAKFFCDASPSHPEHTDNGNRIRRRLMFEVHATAYPLYDAQGPQELMRAILHLAIGLRNYWNKGWVHCDVYIENTLFYRVPKKCTPFTEFGMNLTDCYCMLMNSDGPGMWRVYGLPIAQVMDNQGTTSRRLLFAYRYTKPVLHTPIDDLESCLWVAIRTALIVATKMGHSSNEGYDWLEDMSKENAIDGYALRNARYQDLMYEPWSTPVILRPLRALLVELFAIIEFAQKEMEKYMQGPDKMVSKEAEELIDQTHEHFIKTLWEKLDGLDHKWPAKKPGPPYELDSDKAGAEKKKT